MKINELSEESKRILSDGAMLYETWRDAKRLLNEGSLVWRTVRNTRYLYRLHGSKGYGPSLGRESPHTTTLHEQYQHARKTETTVRNRLRMYGGMAKQSKVGLVPAAVGSVLRELDLADVLGTQVLVVGTHALAAYAAEAGVRFSPDTTATIDIDLSRVHDDRKPLALLMLLKHVDATFTVNQEKTFQLRNAQGDEVEVLSGSGDTFAFDQVAPIPVFGQEWLHRGRMVDQVVFDSTLQPARVLAPDPRMFAVHKLWMAQQPDRVALKRTKDRKQAEELIAVVDAHMPHYPWDSEFFALLPDILLDVVRTHPKLAAHLANISPSVSFAVGR